MRLTTIVSSLLLAASAHAADMQSPSYSLIGGHTNAGSNALLAPATPTSGGLGSAGATVGGGISHGDSLGATLSVAGGYWAVESALAATGAGGDLDGDGIPDSSDNCIDRSNADQLDVDGDGYGNPCDFDYNNNGVVDLVDVGGLIDALGDVSATQYDNDGNGVPDLVDLGAMMSAFGIPPGPSAFH
jgi:hypothetical protein